MRAILALDTETTGLGPADEAIEVALVELGDDRCHPWVRRCRPRVASSSGALAVHGITDSDLIDEPPFADLVESIAEQLARAELVVGHHLGFDMRTLVQSGLQAELVPRTPSLCTMEVARELWPGSRHRLSDVALLLGVGPWREHTAIGDALATGEIARALLARFDLARFIRPLRERVR